LNACVVGIGNAFRADDAAGLAVVALLRESLPDTVRIVECEGEPISVLDAWEGYDHVTLVDAMRSGGSPGLIRKFEVGDEPLPAELAGPSTHLLGVREAIGVDLTSAYQLVPEQSTAAMIVHHPEAKYYAVRGAGSAAPGDASNTGEAVSAAPSGGGVP
jgi:hydrogenase maturation protease